MIDWRPMIELPQDAEGKTFLLWNYEMKAAEIGLLRDDGAWWVPTYQTGGEEVPFGHYSHFATINPPDRE